MPRLLIFCEYPTLLGGERSMLSTLPAVTAAGFDVQVASPSSGPLADALRDVGIPIVPWQTHDDAGERLPLSQLRSQLASLISRRRPALLHANSLSTARISGPVALECGVASIGHLRDITSLSHQVVCDLNAHGRLVAVSQATRDFHIAQGIDASRCVVVHNGIDLTHFSPRPRTRYLHQELAIPTSCRLMPTIGQIGLRKATDIVLSAARSISRDVPDAHWLIVGERTSNKEESRELEAKLRSIATEKPLAGRTHFLGVRSDVVRIMNECDLLLHAARQEPLGRVLLEAAASGLPVVATDVGGTREIFPTEADGAVLVPPDDCEALAQAVLAVLTDDDRRQRLAAAARRRAEVAFDVQHAADRLVEQYRQLLTF
jgi:glycosyltransferase involved in cell wall biosynthesis